ncbi:MAG: transposase [Chloroflexi bacterium]|nr:transposase [Chloroflexota bacterium]
MATRLLIIHRQLVFAVTIKQALEQTGLFDVHPFTTADAAFDFLHDHPQDVALVDFALPGNPGAHIIQQLRDIQPDIAVIITPDQPDAELLDIQGVIDMPFTARDLIPVIQQAVELTGGEAPPPMPQTRRAADNRTRVLGDKEPKAPPTRRADEKKAASGKTRIFDDEPEFAPSPGKTRIFDDQPDEGEDEKPAVVSSAQTRTLDDDFHPAQTRTLDDDMPAPPSDLPEFSPLDNVLKSFDFEPLAGEEDTPTVPERDSEAVRQYLATSPDAAPDSFNEVLGAIEPAQPRQPAEPKSGRRADFEELVASMRGDAPHTPLPERQQQSLDFILTSGMDAVLKEIEKAKTGPLKEPSSKAPPPKPDTSFKKLAEEEPPMPTLEQSGTVSDLMVGISDRGFHNVLAMLRGEEVEESQSRERERARPESPDDFASAFTGRETLPEEAEDPAQIRSMPPPNARPEPRTDWWGFDSLDQADDDGESVAHVVLKTTLDQPGTMPIDEVMSEIESRLASHQIRIRPLPSWDMDTSAFRAVKEAGVAEPDFLPEELPPGETLPSAAARPKRRRRASEQAQAAPPHLPEEPPSDASSRTTRPSAAVQEEFAPPPLEGDTALDSSYLEDTAPSKAVAPEPDAPQAEPTAAINPEWLPEFDAPPPVEVAPPGAGDQADPSSVFIGFDLDTDEEWPFAEAEAVPDATPQDETWDEQPTAARPQDQPAWDEDEATALEGWPPAPNAPVVAEAVVDESDDPYIAQLALNLTQVSLELTAEGTVLTRGSEIMAFAGHLSPEDILELRDVVANDWQSNPDGARFRFIRLPSSGKDYMLYSIQTTGDLTLSMIFAGTTPLRVIRHQAQRLAQALESVPEPGPEEPLPAETAEPESVTPPVQIEAVTYNTYACVWLLRDPQERLSDAVAQAIIAGLTVQLQEQNWKISSLQVHEDFIYLLADVPGEKPPHEIMRDLRSRSAEIAHAQAAELTPQMLWADSYYILTPGRELQTEEILEFINFQRML